ncbi:MAG: CapA family protein [Clostridia bacterium]|nr:CapA family protein [Clostridia bacterium]
MKILFASDMSFNYFSEFPGKDAVKKTMENTVKYFKAADFSVVNLENILGNKEDHTPIPKDGPNLMSSEDFVEYIDVLSPTAVGLANNHSRDFGPAPLFRTMEILKDRGYQVFGAGKNIEEAYKPAVFEKDGVRVEVFAVCENEFGIADDDLAGTAGYKLGRVKKAIKEARSRGAVPVIYFHGGNERNPFPSPGKTEMYRNFVDMGAAAVVAMHTHCPQGYEIYEGAPIVYSMGNFYFPKPGLEHTLFPSWSVGYMSLIDINNRGASLEVIPYKFDSTSHTPLLGEEFDYFTGYLDHIKAPIQDEKKIRELFDSWCMIAGIGCNGQLSYMKTVSNFTSASLDEYTKTGSRNMTLLKNVFSCEAHNELITNSLDIVYNRKIDKALSGVDYICKLQQLKY